MPSPSRRTPALDPVEASAEDSNLSPEQQQQVSDVVQVERRFLGWLVGLCTLAALAGTSTVGSLLWSLNSSVVGLKTTVDSLSITVTSVQQQITANTANRYTSEMASQDRTAFNKTFDAINSRFEGINLKYDKVADRLLDHDRQLRDLAVTDAELKGQINNLHQPKTPSN